MTTFLVAVVGITVLSSFAQSVTGLSFALLVVPLLALTDPVTAVVTVTYSVPPDGRGRAHASARRAVAHDTHDGRDLALGTARRPGARARDRRAMAPRPDRLRRRAFRGRRAPAVPRRAAGDSRRPARRAVRSSHRRGFAGLRWSWRPHNRGLGPTSYRATQQAIFCMQDGFALVGLIAVGCSRRRLVSTPCWEPRRYSRGRRLVSGSSTASTSGCSGAASRGCF